MHIGEDVEAHHKNDWEAENGAIKAYNDGIKLAVEVGDNGTREMLESILKDEEGSHRLDRSPTRPDQTDGHPGIFIRADQLDFWICQANHIGSQPLEGFSI